MVNEAGVTPLAGRVAVVTGAAGGMGVGIATALLEDGAQVVLSDLDVGATEAVRAELDPEGTRTRALAADVCDPESLAGLCELAVAELGGLDCWVNNAGVVEMGRIADTPPGITRREFEINFHAVLEGCRVAARRMAGSGGGSIVNVASNAGKVGFPEMVGYNASKAAVINLTRCLAQEWAADGVNVNAVCPGSVHTPMLERVADTVAATIGGDRDDLFDSMQAEQLGRHIEPIEVGRIVAFLLSDRAEIIRGQAINVDGGSTPY